MVLFALGIAPALAVLRIPCDPPTCIPQHWGVLSSEQAQALAARGIALEQYAIAFTGLEGLQALVFAGCGWLIFLRRSDEAIALIASLALVCLGMFLIPNTPQQAFRGSPAMWLVQSLTYIWGNWLFPALLFLLPNGRFVPRWGRWFFVLWGAYISFAIVIWTLNSGVSSPDDMTSRVAGLILLVCAAVGIYGQFYRYRHMATAPQRQQIKWLGFGLLGIFASTLISATIASFPVSSGTTPIEVRLLANMLITLGFSCFPIALAFAILRHRLWEIDLVLNRTLVYGGLSAAIIVLYALIVGGLSALFHGQATTTIAYLGVGLVALLVQPIRERLQRGVNRLLFGQRDEPYAVLARFGRQLETTPALATLLPTITATIKETLRLPVVTIEVNPATGTVHDQPAERAHVQSPDHQRSAAGLTTFPLLYQNEWLGRLIVSPRDGEPTLSAADRRLLEDLARQAGVAVHAARVTTELQQARERLVTAREEERRRLRRDLHDGLGPTLAALTAQAEAARDLVPISPEQSIALLTDMAVQTQAATADIRRLVYNLRPPALDDLGLVGAIRAQARKLPQASSLIVQVDAGSFPLLPAAVEVAAYRIVQEALNNVVRHADAQQCRITIASEGARLRVEIADDGRGLPLTVEGGVGFTSMRERAEELGGSWDLSANNPGTRVLVFLPLPRAADHGGGPSTKAVAP
jgi:signal transduction histidine kinase